MDLTPELTAREQFVQDFTLVTDNHNEAYDEARELVRQNPEISDLALAFADQFENYIQEVADREDELGHEYGALLLRQLLLGYGVGAFYSIAKHYKEEN